MNGRTALAIAVTAALVAPASALAYRLTERVGSLEATGTGTIASRGNLTAFGQINGRILMRDRQGRAVVKINGVRQRPKVVRTGRKIVRIYLIRSARGAFYAQGKDIHLELRSPSAVLSVTMFGRGTVTKMSGEGTFRLNAGTDEQWVSAPVPFRLAPAPPRRQSSVTDLVDRGEVRL